MSIKTRNLTAREVGLLNAYTLCITALALIVLPLVAVVVQRLRRRALLRR